MKKIIILSKSTPDEAGYNDECTVYDVQNGMTLYHGACSTCPNPYKPKTLLKWQEAYAWVAPGEYTFECWISPKHGKCLQINELKAVPTRYPNVNHDMQTIATLIEMHEGYSDTWRGSAGCLTMRPFDFLKFIGDFSIGEKGEIVIINSTGA